MHSRPRPRPTITSRLRPACIALTLISACSSSGVECDDTAIRGVVQQFGSGMQNLSLMSPDRLTTSDLSTAYEPYVTPELLASWSADIREAPGTREASRWSSGMEVTAIRGMADGCRVEADIRYVNRATPDGRPSVEREPVILRVVSSEDGSWRIAAYRVDTESSD